MNAIDPRPVVDSIVLNGGPLSFRQLARIGARNIALAADDEALARVDAARAVVLDRIAAGLPVYGTTTGVGAMKDVDWSPEQQDVFNMGLVRAHHFGTGAPFPLSVVRGAMAIRVNTALTGRVGCSRDLVDAFLALLARDVVPVVRRTGSIGCADIGLMGQIGAVLTGVGEAVYQNRRMSAETALGEAGLRPIRMAPRDALAAVGINAVGYAAAVEALRAAAGALRMLLATSLTTAGALGASRDPWRAVAAVGTWKEADIGAWLHEHTMGWDWPNATHVQDPLSLRMMAQIFGAVFEALEMAGNTVLYATGRPDDNPVVVDGEVLTSGGSLPLDVTMLIENAQTALAHAARNSFNRCVLLGNGARRDLPINLVPRGAIATGFGPVIKLAGELFARVLSMANPVSAQSLVVAAGIEDEAAFLPLVVERFERQVRALRRLAALEGLLAAQAMDILGDRPSGVAQMIYEKVRRHAAFYREDRPLSAEVEVIETDLGSDASLGELISHAPLPALDSFFALGPVD
jgi:histidine ammonia-lyase